MPKSENYIPYNIWSNSFIRKFIKTWPAKTWKQLNVQCFSKTIESLKLLLSVSLKLLLSVRMRIVSRIEQNANWSVSKHLKKEGGGKKHYAWNGRKRDCSKTTWPFCVVTCRPERVNIVVLSACRAKTTAIRYLKRI